MGYGPFDMLLPSERTSYDPSEDYWEAFSVLGNAFALGAISHVLAPLLPLFTGVGEAPPSRPLHHLPSSFEEVADRVRHFQGNYSR